MKKNTKILCAILCAVILVACIFMVYSFGASETSSDGLYIPKQDDSGYYPESPVALDYPAVTYAASKKLEQLPQTLEAWVFIPSTLADDVAVGPIFGNFSSEGSYGDAFLNYEITAGRHPRILWADEFAYNQYDIVFEKVTLPQNEWTHVSFVYDNNTGIVRCYVDGSLAEEKYFYPALCYAVTDFSFVLGGDQRTAHNAYFKGELKDVAVFSTARNAEQIAADYVSVDYATEGLLCYYDVDATSMNADIPDKTGNGYDLFYSKTWLTEEEMQAIRAKWAAEGFKADYSFAVFGDTQKVTENLPNQLTDMYSWVAQNKENKNIVYSLGLGDITDDNGKNKYSKDENGKWVIDAAGAYNEWDVFYEAISKLEGVIPYSVVRGNHDTVNNFNASVVNLSSFTAQFDGTNGGKYTDTEGPDPKSGEAVSYANTWHTLSVNGTNYLFLNLDWGITDVVIDWASRIISQEKFADYKVIISTHCYLSADGTTNDAGDLTPPSKWSSATLPLNDGDDIWNKFISKHSNIEFVLSGHITSNEVLLSKTNSTVNGVPYTVMEMLINPQAVDYRFRSGLIAMLYFDDSANKMAVEYYAPSRGMYYMTASQFMVDLGSTGNDPKQEAWDGNDLIPPEGWGASGWGTADKPYEISSPSNLLWMSKYIIDNEGACFVGKYFRQTCDIDLDGKAIQSIGYKYFSYDKMAAFAGNYDGGGYSIKNGTIAAVNGAHAFNTSYGHGLFGAIFGSVIENVVLEDVEIVGRGVTGGIVGIAAAPEISNAFSSFNIISGCEIRDSVKITTLLSGGKKVDSGNFDDTNAAGRIGTVCGMAHSTLIEGCNSAASFIFTPEFTMVGGIAGSAGLNTVIENCAYTGAITPNGARTSDDAIGSVVGALSPTGVTLNNAGVLTSARGSLAINGVYSTAAYPFVAYKTVSDGFTFSEADCTTEAAPEIDAAIADIKANGSERSFFIGTAAPTGTAADGTYYYDIKNRTYYTANAGSFVTAAVVPAAYNPLATPYGEIAEDYVVYPMALFVKSGGEWTFYNGYDSYVSMMDSARARCGSNTSSEAVVYFRADVTMDTYTSNFGWNVGKITFDLGGHTLYQDGDYHLFPAVAKYANAATQNNLATYGADGLYEVKNGNIVLNTKGLFYVSAYGAKYNSLSNDTQYKKLYYTFSGVNVSLKEGSNLSSVFGDFGDSSSIGTDGNIRNMLLDVTFDDDCTIDITNATKTVNIFDANDETYTGTVPGKSYGAINSITNIHVGAIDVKADSAFTWYELNENNGSSIDFEVGLNITTVGDVTLPATAFEDDNGLELAFGAPVENSAAGTKTYTLMPDDTAITTPYGTVAASYRQYKLLVFERDGDSYKLLGGFNTLVNALVKGGDNNTDNNAECVTKDTFGAEAVVYFLDDVDFTSGYISGNLGYSIGKIIIDLGGNTLTHSSSEPLFRAYAKYFLKPSQSSNYYKDGYFEIKNGDIVLGDHGLFRIGMEGSSGYDDYVADAPSYKTLHWTFDGVDISVASGSEMTSLLGIYNESTHAQNAAHKMGMNIKFNDNCTIDITNAPAGITLFDANDKAYSGKISESSSSYNTNSIVNVTVGGINITAGANGFKWFDVNRNNGSSVTFVVGDNGYFARLTVPSGTTPKLDVDLEGVDKTFTHDLYKLSGTTYTLIETPYGSMGSAYADASKYPYAVFNLNSDGTYSLRATTPSGKDSNGNAYVKGDNFTNFSLALESARTSTYVKEDTRVVYVRRDVATEKTTSNTNWSGSTIVVDLGGNTISPVHCLMYAYGKFPSSYTETNTASCNPAYHVFKNGEIVLNKYGLFQIGAYGEKYDMYATDDHYKVLNFEFKNVKITLAEGATLKSITGSYVEDESVGVYIPEGSTTPKNVKVGLNITYDGCVFDLREATNTINPFNANDSKFKGVASGETYYYTNNIVNITVGDVRIIAGNATINPFFSVAKNGSSVTFVKGESGKYVTLELPSDKAAPDYKVNGDSMCFVKVSEGTETTVYGLAPIDVQSFVPKMSLTLDRNLILNVYVPAAALLNSFTLDGVEYTDFDGLEKVTLGDAEYYLVKISLDAKSAARDVVLRANVTLGEKSAVGTFKFGIIKYAEKILADGGDVEKTLVKDVLSYVRVAYAYFGTVDSETVSRINAILGKNYDENNAPAIEGSATAEASGLKSATFSLDGTPAMRFYLADGADASKYAFFIDGTRVKTETSADGTYIDIDVYAYALCETVTYTIDGVESGSFHINTYYEWSKTQNNENLVNLVARFWKYLQSARAYRDSVVEA